MSQSVRTICEELHDKVFTFKVFNNLTLLKTLKSIIHYQVYLDLKDFCSDELKVKVLIFFLVSSFTKNLFLIFMTEITEILVLSLSYLSLKALIKLREQFKNRKDLKLYKMKGSFTRWQNWF